MIVIVTGCSLSLPSLVPHFACVLGTPPPTQCVIVVIVIVIVIVTGCSLSSPASCASTPSSNVALLDVLDVLGLSCKCPTANFAYMLSSNRETTTSYSVLTY
jgi:hypothetical protein